MKLEWLAAALSPSDVAPHPNFFSSESITPHSLLALLAQLRWSDYARLTDPSGETDSMATESIRSGTSEMEMVEAVKDSMNLDSVARGARKLASLVRDETLDPACAVTAGLFASVAFSELDRHGAAIEVIQASIDRLPRRGADARLLRAVALQQQALRQLEFALPSRDAASECLSLVRDLSIRDLSPFSMSKGVRWPSSHTMALIVDELRAVSDAHLATLEFEFDSKDWVRFVRAPAPVLSLRVRRASEESLERFVKESFDSYTKSTARTFFAGDLVEEGVYSSLLHYELMGADPQCRAWRALLGRLRLLRASGPNRTWYRQDSVRLLRQAGDLASLDLAVNHLRAEGPLEALKAEALQILQGRLDRGRIRRAELSVLMAAAHLLSPEDAGRALDAVIQWLRFVPTPPRGWEAPSVRVEAGWLAAVQLAATAGRLDEIALSLLGEARALESPDELVIRALVRAAAGIEWEGVRASTRAAWSAWLSEGSSAVVRAMLEVVGPAIGLHTITSSSPIERGAALLNRLYRTGSRPSDRELESTWVTTLQQLRQTRAEARRGRYSFGVFSPADIAAGLAADAGLPDVWPELIEFLLDPKVNRAEKTPALDRLARMDEGVPPAIRDVVAPRVRSLISAPAIEPVEDNIVPFPAALRFAARHGFLDGEELLDQVVRLGGSQGSTGRVEAARTLGLLARGDEVPGWVGSLTLQLSHDQDAVVRGEAGRCLASLLIEANEDRSLYERRAMELLSEDGLVIPILVLRGLQELGKEAHSSSAVFRVVRRLRSKHAARGVRLQAAAVLRTLGK